MTDKRKDEMPEEIFVWNRYGNLYAVRQYEGEHHTAYVRKDSSPPMPDDVVDVLEYLDSKHYNAQDFMTSYGDVVRSLLIRAASTPSVEVMALREALEMISGKRQCLDNLMSNVDIAEAALNQPHTGGK